jgi:octaprenyl-diphosphate synthase
MADIYNYFTQENQEDLARVNKIIREQAKSDVTLINEIGHYIITSGGKRLRPIILILAGKSLGYSGESLFEQGAVIEFIHTATLLHDDVVDESDLRRGERTANHIFGNAAAVLVGDFLYTRAFQLMVRPKKLRLMEIMADATNQIAAGEVMQLIHIGNVHLSEQDYFKIILNKTAKLFEAAAQIGALLAGADETQETALKDYGRYLGMIFQIVDDLLDYEGNIAETGKNVGNDLKEGKVTLPLIYLLQEGDESSKNLIKKALAAADGHHFDAIYKAVKNSSALSYCYQVIEGFVKKAQEALSYLPESRYRTTLSDLLDQSVKRKK